MKISDTIAELMQNLHI